MIKKILKRLNLLALLILANSLMVTAEAVSAKSQNSKPTAHVSLLSLAASAEEPQAAEQSPEQLPAQPLRQVQLPAATVVEIIDIRLAPTETGLEVLLETAEEDLLAPEITNSQNALIVEFP